MAVADDQFALPTANGDHRINRLEAGLHGGINIFTLHYTRGNPLDRAVTAGFDRTLSVNRLAKCIDHPAHHAIANRDRSNTSSGTDQHAFFDAGILTHDDDAHMMLLKTESNAHDAIGKLDQFL